MSRKYIDIDDSVAVEVDSNLSEEEQRKMAEECICHYAKPPLLTRLVVWVANTLFGENWEC